MTLRRRGHPRSTPADRARCLGLRNARRIQLAFEAAHLCKVAFAATGERRSLRLQYLTDNNDLLTNREKPFYELVLYGEPGYFDDDVKPPPDSYIIRIT